MPRHIRFTELPLNLSVEDAALAPAYSGLLLKVGSTVSLKCRLSLAAALAIASSVCASSIEPTPSFTDLQGRPHTFAELRGHLAVVNFWATWCGPCREEMPRLQKLADSYAQHEVRFIAISLDAPDTQGKIPTVTRQRGFNLPVWTGATEHTLATLQLGELVPATLVLDEEGNVIGRIEGEARDKDVRSRLDWLLGSRQGKPPKPVQKNDW